MMYRNQKKMFGLGRLKAGVMNKSEAEYSELLERRKLTGQVIDYKFEAVTFKLAPDTRYTPDFFVLLPNMEIEFYEVKGWMMEDSFVKIKIAAELFPFRFFLVRKKLKRDGGGWDVKEVG
jgi:hypothetical protein